MAAAGQIIQERDYRAAHKLEASFAGMERP